MHRPSLAECRFGGPSARLRDRFADLGGAHGLARRGTRRLGLSSNQACASLASDDLRHLRLLGRLQARRAGRPALYGLRSAGPPPRGRLSPVRLLRFEPVSGAGVVHTYTAAHRCSRPATGAANRTCWPGSTCPKARACSVRSWSAHRRRSHRDAGAGDVRGRPTALEARVIVGNVLIPVTDLDEAIAFYGLPVKFRDGDRFAALNGGGVTVALAGPAEHVTASAAPSFKVDSVRQAVPDLVARGAEVVREPRTDRTRRGPYCAIPQENVFVLYSPL